MGFSCENPGRKLPRNRRRTKSEKIFFIGLIDKWVGLIFTPF
jgi:hypothetical protein